VGGGVRGRRVVESSISRSNGRSRRRSDTLVPVGALVQTFPPGSVGVVPDETDAGPTTTRP
jgi:hypothetical protein